MNKRDIGLTLVMGGLAFLMVSFVVTTSTILWGVSLGASIILNMVGVAIIMQFLNTPKTKSNV